MGGLADFASAIVLALIAVLIGWESVPRLARPSRSIEIMLRSENIEPRK
jgi:Co/Zn/Cd efflux system component